MSPRRGVAMKPSASPLLSKAPTVHMRHPQPTFHMEHGLGQLDKMENYRDNNQFLQSNMSFLYNLSFEKDKDLNFSL